MSRVLMIAYTNYRRDPRVRRQAEALVEVGHHVTFLASSQRNEARSECIDGVQVVKLFSPGNARSSTAAYLLDYGLFFLLAMLHSMRHVRRYDLVHVNNMPDFLVFAAWLPRLLGRPVLHDIHDLMPELYATKFGPGRGRLFVRVLRWQERAAGRFASAVLTVEQRLKDILSSRGIPEDKITVLLNLPDERIFRASTRQARTLARDRFVLVYHGTLAHRLGLDVAIRAVARVRHSIPTVELRIIGAGEERAALVALRDELGLGDAVSFSEGFVPVESIPALLEDASIGVVPLRISEGTDIMLPTKLLEYVLLGIPCIVPRTGTIARYFDSEMVEFFEAESDQSLARAIERLYLDPARRRLLVANATERFGKHYNWADQKKVYLGLVERLLGVGNAA